MGWLIGILVAALLGFLAWRKYGGLKLPGITGSAPRGNDAPGEKGAGRAFAAQGKPEKAERPGKPEKQVEREKRGKGGNGHGKHG